MVLNGKSHGLTAMWLYSKSCVSKEITAPLSLCFILLGSNPSALSSYSDCCLTFLISLTSQLQSLFSVSFFPFHFSFSVSLASPSLHLLPHSPSLSLLLHSHVPLFGVGCSSFYSLINFTVAYWIAFNALLYSQLQHAECLPLQGCCDGSPERVSERETINFNTSSLENYTCLIIDFYWLIMITLSQWRGWTKEWLVKEKRLN